MWSDDANIYYKSKKMKETRRTPPKIGVRKVKCRCRCHTHPCMKHVIACCDNGWINMPEITQDQNCYSSADESAKKAINGNAETKKKTFTRLEVVELLNKFYYSGKFISRDEAVDFIIENLNEQPKEIESWDDIFGCAELNEGYAFRNKENKSREIYLLDWLKHNYNSPTKKK